MRSTVRVITDGLTAMVRQGPPIQNEEDDAVSVLKNKVFRVDARAIDRSCFPTSKGNWMVSIFLYAYIGDHTLKNKIHVLLYDSGDQQSGGFSSGAPIG